MKRILVFLFMLMLLPAVAQDFEQLQRMRTLKVRMELQDSKTYAPIPYATVYLIPQGDTTITHFAISDDKGIAVLEDVVQRKYDLHAELIGYKPFVKTYDLKITGFENDRNLGVIKLEEDAKLLEAASVSAIGNPVVIKKDTVEYNASAYHVVENAMLVDLLKKMPGIKVESSGTVKVNGETVNKITVGGKAFFIKDPSMAVKNLPAKIVNKIQVIDKAKEDAAFTGVGTKDDQEKVMDIMLKEEYQKGWFGNAKVSGGLALLPEGEKDFKGRDGALFNGNTMISRYNTTDQLVFIGNAKNAPNPGSWSETEMFGMPMDEDDALASKEGLQTTAQAGLNYNTSRIPGFDTNASVSYNFQRKDARESSSRTNYNTGGANLLTNGNFLGTGTDHTVSGSMEFSNTDQSKFLAILRPYWMYTTRNQTVSRNSQTLSGLEEVNSSTATQAGKSNIFSTFAELELGIKNLGKTGRSLTLTGNFDFTGSKGNSTEQSLTRTIGGVDQRNLLYNKQMLSITPQLELTYVEPLGANWALQLRTAGNYAGSQSTRDAFNGADGSVNANYTSFSRNDDITIRERLLFQYKKNDTAFLFGFQLDEEQNITRTRFMGVENLVGQGKWILNWAPYVNLTMKDDNRTLRFEYTGRSVTPTGSRIVPTLDLTNPIQISTGNIYLRPQFTHNAFLSFRTGNPKDFSFAEFFLTGSLNTRQIVQASWFDESGIRYALPVNSPKPGGSVALYASWNQPFGKQKRFTLTLDGSVGYDKSVSYQATQRLPGLNKDQFDYSATMASLWGDASGSKFYSGQSGFAQSNTGTLTLSLFPSLDFKTEQFSLTLRGLAENRRTRYSLDPKANMNTWDFNVSAESLYTTSNGWQFNTDISYNFYRGYTQGYGQPELLWNAGIGKEIGPVTLSVKVADILNQQKSLQRSISANFVEDVYRNVMGRYIMIGVSFNFGKMNATQANKAQRALWEMM